MLPRLIALLLLSIGLACGTRESLQETPADQPMTKQPTLFEASIVDLQRAMDAGSLTSLQLVDYYIDRIERYDWAGPEINSVRAIADNARQQARALDAERKVSGSRGLLHGIPVLVKDNYETRDMTTTAGSKTLAGFNSGRDAEAVARLRAAGAVILGKTNMHEFAYGITTVGSLFGQTRNPYDPERNAGGSSGGTGAAIAANFAAAGMGSDTCGSIRIPAARNNLVGLRGTQGLSSRHGIVPLSSTQDIGGPITRSVADLAIMLDATIGSDAKDPQTRGAGEHLAGSFHGKLNADALRQARFGLAMPLLQQDDADRTTAAVITSAVQTLRRLGAQVVELPMPELEALIDDPWNGHLVIIHDFKWHINDYLSSLPSTPVNDLDEILQSKLAHDAVLPNLQASASISTRNDADYQREIARRDDLRAYLERILDDNRLDALIYPSIRRAPTALGDHQQLGSNCRPSAKSGLPAISIPVGFDNEGLPVGMELLGRAWSEQRLLDLAHSFETTAGTRRPPAATPAD